MTTVPPGSGWDEFRLEELAHLIDPQSARFSGGQWMVRCPCHPDVNPSLGLRVSDDGTLLVNCYAGCDRNELWATVLAVAGGGTVDTAPPRRVPSHEPAELGPPVGEPYVYTDEEGEPVFRVQRYAGKRFRQDRYVGGAWHTGLEGARRAYGVLFRLPDVVKAVASLQDVWWVEGEKDALAVTAAGVCGTTIAMGAQGRLVEAETAFLSGGYVTVVIDRDVAGVALGRRKVAALATVATKVRVLAPPEPFKDVSELLESPGGGLDQMVPFDLDADDKHRAGSRESTAQAAEGASEGGSAATATDSLKRAPTPLHQSADVPTFPLAALPDWLSRYVRMVSTSTQVPIDMAGAAGLGVLSAAVGGRTDVVIRADWSEPTNLYVLIIAESGTRKSAVMRQVAAPLLSAETDLVSGLADVNANRSANQAAAQAEVERLKKEMRKSKKPDKAEAEADDQGALNQLAAAMKVLEECEAPHAPQLVADDVTPEALASMLADNGGRISVVSAEGGLLDIIAGRYSKGIPNLDVILKGHAGDTLRVDRKSRDTEYVERPALTLVLMGQPVVLRSLGRHEQFKGRGLVARFLYVLPPSVVGHRQLGFGYRADVEREFGQQLYSLAMSSAQAADTRRLTMSDEARGVLTALDREVEPLLAEDAPLAHMADWASKVVGATARIAGLLHVAEHPVRDDPEPINSETMIRAVELGRYFTGHARAALDLAAKSGPYERAAWVLDTIRRRELTEFTVRDLFTTVTRSRFESVGVLTDALNVLEDHGWVDAKPTQLGKVGRPASREYVVHPAAHDANQSEEDR